MTSGTTAQDYTRNVTSKVKLGGALSLFSGSLSSSFSSTQHYTSKYSIADYTSFIRRRRLFLTASTELLSKYLTKMFVDDLSKQSIESLNHVSNVIVNYVISYFSYEKEVNGKKYFYLASVHKSTDAFYLVQYICLSKNKEKYEPKFLTWDKTVKFD